MPGPVPPQPPYVPPQQPPPYTPGDEIAQGAPADIGGLNPILALLMKLIKPDVVQPQPPSPWAQGGAPGEAPMPPLKQKMMPKR